jgi:hypothetical protein
MPVNAIIVEQGNGWPEAGAYAPADDGNLYVVIEASTRIQTGAPGQGNWVHAKVAPAEWDDADEADIFPALIIL